MYVCVTTALNSAAEELLSTDFVHTFQVLEYTLFLVSTVLDVSADTVCDVRSLYDCVHRDQQRS
jgi:hypothetical protein